MNNARHGARRISKAVTAGAIPPVMLKSASNPAGLPKSVFDGLRAGVGTNRSQFYKDLSVPFFGANRTGSKVPDGVREQFWFQSMHAGLRGAYECIKEFSETDFTEDLKKIDVPMLIIRGDDDQIVPIDDSARLSAKLVKGSVLKIYPGASHGLPMTSAEQFNGDVAAFIRG